MQGEADEQEQQSTSQNVSIKILVIGEAGVGKSSIIQKYVNNFFPEMYKQSLGCDFFGKKLELPNGKSANLSIWDCSSVSLKSKMLKTYIYESDAVLFVYDITNKSSFDALPNLVKQVTSVLAENPNVFYALVGNKNDLFNQIAVEDELSLHLAKSLSMPFFSVSAKIGSNLNESIKQLVYRICKIPLVAEEKKGNQQSDQELPDLRSEVKGNANKQSSSSSGCSVF